jgi:hypothetical protein
MFTKEQLDFITPASPVNEPAFERMCKILDLSDEDRRLARMAVSTYETAKGRHDGKC